MRSTYNNTNNIDNNRRLNLLNNPYMSNTTTHLTPNDILTRDDLAELAIWESAQFNSSNIIHQHDFISLAAANRYPTFNYPTTTNSIATRQPIFSVPPPTSLIFRVAIPGSLIDNNNHTTKKESAKSSSSNDAPKNISTNQKTLLPKPLQETHTSISSSNNNSHGHGNESKNQSSSSSVIMSDDDNDDNGDDNNDIRPVKQDQAAKLTADEDKRRRNTAASARFRVKKKLREKELERTAKEMTARTELLDERVKELEMENKWLRNLIVEKDAKLLSDVIDKNKDK